MSKKSPKQNLTRVFLSFPDSYYEKYAKQIATLITTHFPNLILKNYKTPQHCIGETERESDRNLQTAEIGIFIWGKDFKRSDSCQRELDNFYARESCGNSRVLLINVDETDRPAELRGKNCVNFSASSFADRFILSLGNIINLTYSSRLKSQPQKTQTNDKSKLKISTSRSKRLNPTVARIAATASAKTREWGVIRRSDSRDVLIKDIAQGRAGTVYSKLLYSTYYGSQAWSQNCHRPSYLFYWNSAKELNLRISEIIDIAIRESKDPEFDLISIGCGNGIKDESVLTAMLSKLNPDSREHQFIYYYPFDISPHLLAEAEDAVLSPTSAANLAVQKGSLKIKGILGDLKYLSDGDEIYEEYKGNNLFCILGNTIGNQGEQDVIKSLNDAMLPGDFAIIEYNADIQHKSYLEHFCQSDNIRRHWESFSMLVPGITHDTLDWRPINKNQLSKDYHESASSFAEKSVITYARNVKFPINLATKPIKELGLAVLHSYSKTGMEAMINTMRLEILYNDVAHDVGLLLARRPLN